MGVYQVRSKYGVVKTRKAGSSGTACSLHNPFILVVHLFHFLSFFFFPCYDARNLGSNNHRHLAETFSNSSFIPAPACSMQHASCPLSKKVIRVLILVRNPSRVLWPMSKCLSDDRMVRNQDITSLAMTSRSSSSACFRPTWTSVTRRSVLRTYSVPGVELSRGESNLTASSTDMHHVCTIMHYYVCLEVSLPLIVSL